ncbi:type III toxin-antitoxin system ToxN/AbiQ family toxin [Fusobacterium sp. PH5-44]|uniref:type III toxin-antitoxin system ToxN/AbiQ family toxin n=1 Tax=unclassified Fusobacterium TaxID=2648384 RepID=UPI003D1F5F4A
MKTSRKIVEFGIYEVSNDYINYLSRYDNKIENSEGTEYSKERKYLAVILNNGENYLIPFSSPKKSDYDFEGNPRRSITPIIRITVKDDSGKIQLIGKLKTSSMIPVKNLKEIKRYYVTREKDLDYQKLIYNEVKFLKKNKESIIKAANKIYFEKLQNKNLGYIQNTVDFKILEKAALNYSNAKVLTKVLTGQIESESDKKILNTIQYKKNKIKENKIKENSKIKSNTIKTKINKISSVKKNKNNVEE